MSTATLSHTPVYGIHRNDPVNQTYHSTIGNDGIDMGSEESFYPLSHNEVQTSYPYSLPFQKPNHPYFQPQMGFAPTFPTNGVVTYNGGMPPSSQPHNAVPYFQSRSFTSTLSPTSGPSTSTPSPVPVRKEVHKALTKFKPRKKCGTRKATQTAKGELLIGKPKRRRGPNKRPPGTAFPNLLDLLPNKVREALEQDYKGCCESVNITDASTKQKHMFSNRHCKNIPLEYQEHIPNFVCPAFVAFKGSCRSKAGRYDSTDRHCRNCEGFFQVSRGNRSAFPVVITRAQYNLIDHYREIRANSEGENRATDQSTEQVDAHIRMVLADVFQDGLPDWFPVITLGGEPNDSAAILEASTSAQVPTNTTSVAVPVGDHIDLSFQEALLFDLDSVNEGAEASRNGFPSLNLEGESDNSGAGMDASVQLSAMSAPVPVPTHFEQPPRYEPSLFDPETAKECAEALNIAFPASNLEGESNVADPSMVSQAPIAQSQLYTPLPFDTSSVDDWNAFLSSFLQN